MKSWHLAAAAMALAWGTSGLAAGPGNLREAVDLNPDPDILEVELVARPATVDLGGVSAHAFTFNGAIPGPELRLKVGDEVIAHFTNRLPEPVSVHFHGIELDNAHDGTTTTQDPVPTGGSFTYRFRVTRPGIFWYHPHAMMPTDQVFKGLYGVVVVEDPAEAKLIARGALPAQAHTLVLADTTVCKAPGKNDGATFAADPQLPWSLTAKGLGSFPGNSAFPTPRDLCETPRDSHGHPLPGPLAAGDIPNVQPPADCGGKLSCRVNEGQIVLGNGRIAPRLEVRAGEGLRLRLVNAAVSRYFRLWLADAAGRRTPLYRVGGEGGLLDRVRIEGGKQGSLDLQYDPGEVLLANADRADVVFTVPDMKPGEVLTLWTGDYQHYGTTEYPYGYGGVPSVPVLRLEVVGSLPADRYFRTAADAPLRLHEAVNDPVENLRTLPLSARLLDPASFDKPLPGTADPTVLFTVVGLRESIDGIHGMALEGGGSDSYRDIPHLASSRYARLGDLLELTVRNGTQQHHPLHLHGFSFQPVRLLDSGGKLVYEYDYNEFMDTIDIPATHQLVFRVRLHDRPLASTGKPGGGLGRWMLHCHIFNHAGIGMMGELVVVE